MLTDLRPIAATYITPSQQTSASPVVMSRLMYWLEFQVTWDVPAC